MSGNNIYNKLTNDSVWMNKHWIKLFSMLNTDMKQVISLPLYKMGSQKVEKNMENIKVQVRRAN